MKLQRLTTGYKYASRIRSFKIRNIKQRTRIKTQLKNIVGLSNIFCYEAANDHKLVVGFSVYHKSTNPSVAIRNTTSITVSKNQIFNTTLGTAESIDFGAGARMFEISLLSNGMRSVVNALIDPPPRRTPIFL